MKTPLVYGCFSALGGAVLTLLLYFFGFHDSVEGLAKAQWVAGIAGLAIFITCDALAMRDKRARVAAAGGSWGYGSALGAGAVVAVVSAVLSAIFMFIYSSFINPHMSDLIFSMQQAKMEAAGMSAAQLEKAEPMMRRMMSPGISSAFQAIGGSVILFLISLIVAIFFRNPGPTVATDVPPAIP